MTKKTLLLSTLFPVSLIVLVTAIVLACADIEVSPYPDSFFAPEISHSPHDADFFVSSSTLYEKVFKDDYTEDFHTNNISEWSSYFNNKVNSKDLEYIIYKARLGEVDTLIFTIKKPSYPITAKLKTNSILSTTDTRSAIDFLYYIGYAKRCEKYSTYPPANDWQDEKTIDANDPRNDKNMMETLEVGGIKQISNASSDFVKQRYAFQVVRLYFQQKSYDSCINFYNNNAALLNKVENTIRYRAMGYLAGAYMAMGQVAEANSTYAIIFDRCDAMRDAAYFSFKPQDEADFAQSLTLAANNRQKETLWQMLGLSKDPLRALKEVYKLDPKSNMLDLLLMRTVNQQEERFINQDWVVGEYINPNDSLTYLNTRSIDMDAVNFIKTVAKSGNTAKPYEWSLAAGYLDWASNGKDFETYFAGAAAEASKDKLVAEELRLIRLLDKLKNGKAGDNNFEQAITPELKWLSDTGHAKDFRQQFAWIYVSDVLAKKYAAIGNIALSKCFTPDLINRMLEDNYLNVGKKPISDSLITVLENFIDKKNKSPFEEFALTKLPLFKYDFLQIESIYAMYNYDFKTALDKISTNFAAQQSFVYGDPFIIHINDNHDSDAVLPNKSVADRKAFLERMIDLQKKAPHDGKNSAEDYFLLANGCYNISYFGNCRVFYDTKIFQISDGILGYGGLYINNDTTSLPVYMNCNMALQYYQKAMDASKDPEFKAKCCFMMAKCEQNYFFCHKTKGYVGDFKGGKYFTELRNNYSSTKYFSEVINECGYFKYWANEQGSYR